MAGVRHLAEQHHLDLSILQGDGTNTVAKKGDDASVILATNISLKRIARLTDLTTDGS